VLDLLVWYGDLLHRPHLLLRLAHLLLLHHRLIARLYMLLKITNINYMKLKSFYIYYFSNFLPTAKGYHTTALPKACT
jgi:hypothetical protein